MRSRRARLRFTDRDQNALKWSYRSIDFQRTANSVLTVCVSRGDNPSKNPARNLNVYFDKNLKKHLLAIDFWADDMASDLLHDKLGDNLVIRGEESSLQAVSKQVSQAVLLDMVDGTDLLQRGFGNWCAAMVFYSPVKEGITCALVGTPDYDIYYMKASDKCAYLRSPVLGEANEFEEREIAVDKKAASEIKTLRNAGIAFYGQKAGSFLSLYKQMRFVKELEQVESLAAQFKRTTEEPLFRIYNLAGNPMMMQLIEGKVDAIIECRGQLCHDVVPGFAIALNAGACLIDLDTKKNLTIDMIGKVLPTPERKFRYVMASNQDLAEEIASLLD